MNAIYVDGLWGLCLIPVDCSCEGHIIGVALWVWLTIQVRDDSRLIHIFLLGVFAFHVAEVLKGRIRKRGSGDFHRIDSSSYVLIYEDVSYTRSIFLKHREEYRR